MCDLTNRFSIKEMKCIHTSKAIVFVLFASQLISCAKGSFQQVSSAGESSPEVEAPSVGFDSGQEDRNSGFDLAEEARKFKLRYQVTSASTKLTDDRGAGNSDLYGTRNFRVVLHGVMYRGGANNKYLTPPRSNTNPLPTVGLNNLCREDFSAAVYLYSENFSTAPKQVSCKNTSHQDQVLQYKQYAAAGEAEKILALVYDRIKGKLNGPIYAHCWNGWHSSGLISAMALKQFCNWSDSKADAYWVKNTDGNSSGFTTLRKRIKDFKPLAKFQITEQERSVICPETY